MVKSSFARLYLKRKLRYFIWTKQPTYYGIFFFAKTYIIALKRCEYELSNCLCSEMCVCMCVLTIILNKSSLLSLFKLKIFYVKIPVFIHSSLFLYIWRHGYCFSFLSFFKIWDKNKFLWAWCSGLCPIIPALWGRWKKSKNSTPATWDYIF